jgi:hypothetical protein
MTPFPPSIHPGTNTNRLTDRQTDTYTHRHTHLPCVLLPLRERIPRATHAACTIDRWGWGRGSGSCCGWRRGARRCGGRRRGRSDWVTACIAQTARTKAVLSHEGTPLGVWGAEALTSPARAGSRPDWHVLAGAGVCVCVCARARACGSGRAGE